MNILITGGAGFIGSHLALALAERGDQVTVLDNLLPQIHGDDAPLPKTLEGRTRFLKGDVRSRQDLRVALEGQDAVVHLAAETGTGQSMYEIERYVDVNVRGTALLLELLATEPHQVRKLVVASSRAIYGEGKYDCCKCGIVYPVSRQAEDMSRGDFAVKCPSCGADARLLPTDESSKAHPSSVYGITKFDQEHLVLTVGRSLGIPSIAFRYQNVYGPGQSLKNPYTGILSIFSTRIRNGNEIVVFEDGRESRDFVYIDDVVRATIAGLDAEHLVAEAFNVGSGVRTDVHTVARSLVAAYGAEVPVRISGNFRAGDIRDNYADLARVTAVLGFRPEVDFATGIQRFAAWVATQEGEEDRYEQSMQEMKAKGLYR